MYTNPPPQLKEFNEKNAETFAYVTEHAGTVSFFLSWSYAQRKLTIFSISIEYQLSL